LDSTRTHVRRTGRAGVLAPCSISRRTGSREPAGTRGASVGVSEHACRWRHPHGRPGRARPHLFRSVPTGLDLRTTTVLYYEHKQMAPAIMRRAEPAAALAHTAHRVAQRSAGTGRQAGRHVAVCRAAPTAAGTGTEAGTGDGKKERADLINRADSRRRCPTTPWSRFIQAGYVPRAVLIAAATCHCQAQAAPLPRPPSSLHSSPASVSISHVVAAGLAGAHGERPQRAAERSPRSMARWG